MTHTPYARSTPPDRHPTRPTSNVTKPLRAIAAAEDRP